MAGGEKVVSLEVLFPRVVGRGQYNLIPGASGSL